MTSPTVAVLVAATSPGAGIAQDRTGPTIVFVVTILVVVGLFGLLIWRGRSTGESREHLDAPRSAEEPAEAVAAEDVVSQEHAGAEEEEEAGREGGRDR